MAKRRKTRTRTVYRKAKRRYKRGGGAFSLQKLMVPIGIATFAEPLIDNYAKMLPIPTIGNFEADDMVKVAVGWYLGKKGGVMGNTAKMIGIFGLRNLMRQGLGNVLSGQTQAASQGF